MLGILWLFPKTHAASRYDHDYPYIMMFHAMREVSLAFVLFSSAHFVRARLQKGEVDGRGSHFHEGRNYLLLGSICFLVSEFVGIIWCQNGWGDVWRWSTNFFQSALIVLYFMVAFHIPGKGLLAERVRRLVGGTGGVFFLALTLIRGLP